MKLSILIPSFLPVMGGAEIGAFELARRLTGRGHTVSVITPRLDRGWILRETIDGVDVHRYDVPAVWRRDRTLNLLAASYWRLGRLLRLIRPDVLNMHYLLPTGLAGQWWASRLGIPTVVTLIGMDVYDPLYRPAGVLRILMRRGIRRANAVTCISTFVRDVVAREYPPASDGLFMVIPYGVDIKRFHPYVSGYEVRERYGVKPDEKLVLTVQRLYARKGVQHFIRAAEAVRRRCPYTKFLIVGDGPERASLETLARDLGLVDRVIFTGEINNTTLPLVYAASDLFAFHTFHEGLGVVLLEAIASGCPVVTTEAGGTVDIIRHGENGLLVPPGDHERLAEAIVRVLLDEALRRSLGSRGRARAEAEFDWDHVAERYRDVFSRVRGEQLGREQR